MSRIRSVHPGLWTDAARQSGPATHLYVIQEGDDGPCKVGIARNAFWRRQDLQTGNYRHLNLRAVFEADQRSVVIIAEAGVLANFSDQSLSGEWLDVPPDVLIRFIEGAF